LTADNSVFQYSNANEMRVTQNLNSFREIIAHAQYSVDDFSMMHKTLRRKVNIEQYKPH
jgi:hypothetical protein